MSSHILQVKKEGDFSYPIYFKSDFTELAEKAGQLERSRRKFCILTDQNVAPLYLKQVKKELEQCASFVTSYILPAGERYKTLEEIQKIYGHLIELGFDRKDCLVALGGGVIGDMTGFAAATYLRGIDFIQIPTTLLAQVDSSIGGKTGVDFDRYKNMVGAFHQPVMVYMNSATLGTLSIREFSCGMGEILKHGFIRDRAYTRWLYENRAEIAGLNRHVLSEMIYRSCVIKKTIVERDPREQGERAVLNFGHTIGHAIEKLKDFSLLHGQCVSIGMTASAYISMKRGYLTEDAYEKMKILLTAFDLPVSVSGLDPEEILLTTKSDKKMEHGVIRFILMKEPGYAYTDTTVTDEELLEAINAVLE